MNLMPKRYVCWWCAFTLCCALSSTAQSADRQPPEGTPGFEPPPFGPGGPGPGDFGPGRPEGMMQQKTKLVDRFDQDGDHRLNADERKAAREFLHKEFAAGRGPRGPGG